MSDHDWIKELQLRNGKLNVVASSQAGEPLLVFWPDSPREGYLIPWTPEMHETVKDAWETSRGGHE